MNASDKAIELIKHYEVFRAEAYLCPAFLPTIGYGSTHHKDGTAVKLGETISEEKALEYLWHEVREVERQVNSMLKVNLTQSQFDALVSFAYNVGTGALRASTLLKVINDHLTSVSITDAFLMWNKIDGSKDGKDNDGDGLVDEPGEKKALPGLTNRRRSEAHLWLYNELFYY